MRLLAIDPGTRASAWVSFETVGLKVLGFAKEPNDVVLERIATLGPGAMELSLEMIGHMGMSVGAEVFETVLWAGRFVERFFVESAEEHARVRKVMRNEVKIHLCGTVKAKDPNIRQALIDLYGGGKESATPAIGLKATPGPLYGFSADAWAALGVAVTAAATPARADRLIFRATAEAPPLERPSVARGAPQPALFPLGG